MFDPLLFSPYTLFAECFPLGLGYDFLLNADDLKRVEQYYKQGKDIIKTLVPHAESRKLSLSIDCAFMLFERFVVMNDVLTVLKEF